MRSRNNQLERCGHQAYARKTGWFRERNFWNKIKKKNSDENKIDKYDQFAVEGCGKYLH